jgi:hypothetical protein
MKKLLEPFYRLLTRCVIVAIDKDVLERIWEDEFKPYGYKLIKKPHKSKVIFSNRQYRMIVCKTLFK